MKTKTPDPFFSLFPTNYSFSEMFVYACRNTAG
jgi:hypothetical protein